MNTPERIRLLHDKMLANDHRQSEISKHLHEHKDHHSSQYKQLEQQLHDAQVLHDQYESEMSFLLQRMPQQLEQMDHEATLAKMKYEREHAIAENLVNQLANDQNVLKAVGNIEAENMQIQQQLETALAKLDDPATLESSAQAAHMQRVVDTLQHRIARSAKEILEYQAALSASESKMKHMALKAQESEDTIKDLKARMNLSDNPILRNQLQQVLLTNDTIRKERDLAKLSKEQQSRHIASLEQELQDARIISEKTQLNVQTLSQLAQESAQVHSEMLRMREDLAHKSKSLGLLKQELVALNEEVRQSRLKEAELREKLKFAVSPQEAARIESQYIACQKNGQDLVMRYNECARHAKECKQMHLQDKAKLHSLMGFLSEAHAAQTKLAKEHQRRVEVENQLVEQERKHATVSEALHNRLKALEDQYAENVIESQRRIAQDEAKLGALEKQIDYWLEKGKVMKNESYQTTATPKIDSFEQHLQKVLAKEQELLNTRGSKYAELNDVLKEPQSESQLLAKLQAIRTRGEARERSQWQDLMELRAMNDKLKKQYGAEYNAIAATQRSILPQALQQSQENMKAYAQSNDLPHLSQEAQRYNELARARAIELRKLQNEREMILQGKTDFTNKLENETLPQMRRVSDQLELSAAQFPNLAKFRQDVALEQKATEKSVLQEAQSITEQHRHMERESDELNALLTQQKELFDAIQKLIELPSESTKKDLIDKANRRTEEMLRDQALTRALHDKRFLRYNIVIERPRSAQAALEQMRAQQRAGALTWDDKINKVQMLYQGETITNLPDSLFVAPQPNEAMQFTSNRLQQAIVTKRDLIIVCYSVQTEGKENLEFSIMFKEALKNASRKLNEMGSDEVKIQLVKTRMNNAPTIDLLANGKELKNCNVRTCSPSVKRVEANTDAIMKQLDGALNLQTISSSGGIRSQSPPLSEQNKMVKGDNLILTISNDANETTIYICDILVPNDLSADIRLTTSNWIDYLRPVIESNEANVDLFFNVIPDPDNTAMNNKLLQLSNALTLFLNSFKTLQGTNW